VSLNGARQLLDRARAWLDVTITSRNDANTSRDVAGYPLTLVDSSLDITIDWLNAAHSQSYTVRASLNIVRVWLDSQALSRNIVSI